MPHYIYLIHPLREGFFEQPTPAEEAAMQGHFDYLKRATEEGVVLLAGPCLDDTFGLVVFQAENEAGGSGVYVQRPIGAGECDDGGAAPVQGVAACSRHPGWGVAPDNQF